MPRQIEFWRNGVDRLNHAETFRPMMSLGVRPARCQTVFTSASSHHRVTIPPRRRTYLSKESRRFNQAAAVDGDKVESAECATLDLGDSQPQHENTAAAVGSLAIEEAGSQTGPHADETPRPMGPASPLGNKDLDTGWVREVSTCTPSGRRIGHRISLACHCDVSATLIRWSWSALPG